MTIKQMAEIFKALSDPNRIRIIKMLQEKTLCVCEIREVIKLANSTVSEHLSILKKAGFIIEKKEGKWVNYLINPKPPDIETAGILSMLGFWADGDEVLRTDRIRCKKADRKVLCYK